MAESEIIIINGAACSGKTTLAREIQSSSDKAYLATGLESFLPMFPGRYISVSKEIVEQQEHAEKDSGIDESLQQAMNSWNQSDTSPDVAGFRIGIASKNGHGPTFTSTCGPLGWSLLSGMHSSFAAMARAGNNLLIADVIPEVLLYHYCKALKGLRVYLVGLYCSLDELTKRERARSDIGVGAAKMQHQKVHKPGHYDLRLDTDRQDPKECASRVIEHVRNNPPRAFDELSKKHADFPVPPFPLQLF